MMPILMLQSMVDETDEAVLDLAMEDTDEYREIVYYALLLAWLFAQW